jgi:hypothetical protein
MDVAQYHRDPNTFLLTKTLYETFEELDAFGLDLSAVCETSWSSLIILYIFVFKRKNSGRLCDTLIKCNFFALLSQ